MGLPPVQAAAPAIRWTPLQPIGAVDVESEPDTNFIRSVVNQDQVPGISAGAPSRLSRGILRNDLETIGYYPIHRFIAVKNSDV